MKQGIPVQVMSSGGGTSSRPYPQTGGAPRPNLHNLLSLQPQALFLLDLSGIVMEVGGAWEHITGLTRADSLGRALPSLLRIPREDAPEGIIAPFGVSERAMLRSLNFDMRVRVVWHHAENFIAGSLEWARPQAEAEFRLDARVAGLEEALDQALNCLGIALDVYKGQHVQRLVSYAERMAQALDLSPAEQRVVRWGAALHDVGKSQIPSEILLKPGALSMQERLFVQQHTSWGADLLDALPFLPAGVREVVLYHHERWDGAGYPNGLMGEQIPLAARIVAIADVFEALTSNRSYKAAWSHIDATDFLRAEAGSAFDPRLVQVFVSEVLHTD